MTLTETFAHHTSQEFPPKFVFCYHDGKPKTIMVSEIAEYETMYNVFGFFVDTSLTNLSSENELPSVSSIK